MISRRTMVAMGAALLVGAGVASAQLLQKSPAPEPTPADVQPSTEAVPTPATPTVSTEELPTNDPRHPEYWRYEYENGRWWYYTTKNEWKYHADGRWITYVPGAPMIGEPERRQYTTYYRGNYYDDGRWYDDRGWYDYGPGYGYYGPGYGDYFYPSRGVRIGADIGGRIGGGRGARAGAILGGLIDGW